MFFASIRPLRRIQGAIYRAGAENSTVSNLLA